MRMRLIPRQWRGAKVAVGEERAREGSGPGGSDPLWNSARVAGPSDQRATAGGAGACGLIMVPLVACVSELACGGAASLLLPSWRALAVWASTSPLGSRLGARGCSKATLEAKRRTTMVSRRVPLGSRASLDRLRCCAIRDRGAHEAPRFNRTFTSTWLSTPMSSIGIYHRHQHLGRLRRLGGSGVC